MRQTLLVGLALLAAACASPTRAQPSVPGAQSSAPKRITVAIIGEVQVLYLDLAVASGVPGDNALEELVNTGLTELDHTGVTQAQLAASGAAKTWNSHEWDVR